MADRIDAVASSLALVVVLLLAGGWSPVVAGQGSSAWLDHPAPSASDQPGSLTTIGFTLWDPAGRAPISGIFPFVRLHPATGAGSPAQVDAVESWTGHYAATLEIPTGGAGSLEIGSGGTACDSSGCHAADTPYRIAGVGPPPDAPLPAIAAASITRPSERVLAGVPVAIEIRLTPNADWEPAAFPLPDALYLGVTVARGAALDPVEARLVDRDARTFAASVTFPGAGDYTLRVATTADPTRDEAFATSLVTLPVEAAAGPPVPAAEPAGGPDVLLVGGLAAAFALVVAVVVGGMVAARHR